MFLWEYKYWPVKGMSPSAQAYFFVFSSLQPCHHFFFKGCPPSLHDHRQPGNHPTPPLNQSGLLCQNTTEGKLSPVGTKGVSTKCLPFLWFGSSKKRLRLPSHRLADQNPAWLLKQINSNTKFLLFWRLNFPLYILTVFVLFNPHSKRKPSCHTCDILKLLMVWIHRLPDSSKADSAGLSSEKFDKSQSFQSITQTNWRTSGLGDR